MLPLVWKVEALFCCRTPLSFCWCLNSGLEAPGISSLTGFPFCPGFQSLKVSHLGIPLWIIPLWVFQICFPDHLWGLCIAVSLPPGPCSGSVCSPVSGFYNWKACFSPSIRQLILQRTHSRLWPLWGDCGDFGPVIKFSGMTKAYREEVTHFLHPKLPPGGHWPVFFFYAMILEILLASPGSLIPKGINANLGEGKQCLPAGFAHQSSHLPYSSPSGCSPGWH